MWTRAALLLGVSAALVLAAAPPASAQGNRCSDEAELIRRAEAELPRLEVAPPDDRQIVCITLETNILFARRISAHVANCPRSPHVRNIAAWQRAGSQYTAQFGDRRCKQAIRAYRG
jgi:hypothetical protein